MLTKEKLKEALIKSGLFFEDRSGLEYGYAEGTDASEYLEDLVQEINKILNETS